LASLFLGIRASGQYAPRAAIRSQVEEGQANNEEFSDALEVSQSHSVDDLSIVFDIDSQSGLGEEVSNRGVILTGPALKELSPLCRQRVFSDSLDPPSVSSSDHEVTLPPRKCPEQ